LRHVVISVPPLGWARFQLDENRAAPSGFASETNNKCQIKSKLLQLRRRKPGQSGLVVCGTTIAATIALAVLNIRHAGTKPHPNICSPWGWVCALSRNATGWRHGRDGLLSKATLSAKNAR
jgi:hypothetical protein